MDLTPPVPDFSRPIEALFICHANILQRMDRLDALAAILLDEGAPAFAAQIPVWEEIVSFFRHSIASHTRDEEEGLFPLLDGRGGEVVETMSFEHRWIEQSEGLMISRFEALRSGEHPTSSTAVRELALMAREVTRHYRAHIDRENTEIFPVAESMLSDAEKRSLGELMQRHRHIEITLPPAIDRIVA